ncbi:RNA 2'-phosphotransferase [Microscilla marina]|uniref:Probable RNA 2'-phosphotransferase n=1 Tax=Microscilla marina ATCC 23134 TaxID=313606 RepID=A1ZGQ9_MICM2|nr:RNA 2'-phosphotransferase [Microscilla marina]EAY30676.1 RNA 2'-phosphotransferase [Microscilla marina ATCC 23134]
MQKNQIVKISKRLSYVLRHRPEEIELIMDEEGWVEVDLLLDRFSNNYFPITLADLQKVVAQNDKKRFAFSDDEAYIRASQGHSIQIDLGYEAIKPPAQLYHGTATRFVHSIREQGLKKRNRHHVHLSADIDTATKVGGRHGQPVILTVNALDMQQDGYKFFQSENGVWLTDQVPVQYLEFPEEN